MKSVEMRIMARLMFSDQALYLKSNPFLIFEKIYTETIVITSIVKIIMIPLIIIT